MAVQYTAALGSNQAMRREIRSQISTPARESLNAKMSWQKLMLILAANFDPKDLVVTLTYRDGDLPHTREDADKRLSSFIRALRTKRREEGKDLVYARVTEGYHGDGRLHHHIVINSTGDDYSSIRKLWGKDGDNVAFDVFGLDGPERWAKYLTKEPREKGRRYVGDRTWRTSVHMKKPLVEYEFVSLDAPLTAPPGAMVLDKTECVNSYGRFCYISARLPETEN